MFITVIIVSNNSNNKNSAICHQPVEQVVLLAAEDTEKSVCNPGAGCKVQLILRSMKFISATEKTVCSDF